MTLSKHSSNNSAFSLQPSPFSFHIIVCIKAVVIRAPRGRIVRTTENSRLNPFDLPALEAALQLKAARGGTVTVLSMGPPSSRIVLAEALAMGADRAVLACDPALAGADTLATAATLAAAAARLSPFDLLLFGTRTSDSDTGQVGPQTAAALGLPLVTGAHRFELTHAGLRVERTLDQWVETFEVDFPAALTLRPEAASPRDIGLGGLAAAFDDDPVEILRFADLGLPIDRVGEAGSPTRVLSMKPVRHERQCQILKGDPADLADQLIHRLTQRGLLD
jgi:electron transfer flavoprotein beta subunit